MVRDSRDPAGSAASSCHTSNERQGPSSVTADAQPQDDQKVPRAAARHEVIHHEAGACQCDANAHCVAEVAKLGHYVVRPASRTAPRTCRGSESRAPASETSAATAPQRFRSPPYPRKCVRSCIDSSATTSISHRSWRLAFPFPRPQPLEKSSPSLDRDTYSALSATLPIQIRLPCPEADQLKSTYL